MRLKLDEDDLEWENKIPDAPDKPTCSSGKVGWRKESPAQAAAKVMRRYRADPALHVYLCPECDQYHIGHMRGSRKLSEALLNFTSKT